VRGDPGVLARSAGGTRSAVMSERSTRRQFIDRSALVCYVTIGGAGLLAKRPRRTPCTRSTEQVHELRPVPDLVRAEPVAVKR